MSSLGHFILSLEKIGKSYVPQSQERLSQSGRIMGTSNFCLSIFLHFLQWVCMVFIILKKIPGFPGGAVVGNLPVNAGDMGSSPGLGRSHMLRSDWAHEPQLLSLCVWSPCSAREAATMKGPRTAMKSGPRSPQLEKALAQKRRPNTAKNK